MKFIPLILSFFSVLILSSSMSLSRTQAAIGNEAPDFTITNQESSVKLADLKGKGLILNFWSAQDAVSRMRNISLSAEARNSGKEFMSICVDSDKTLASQIISQDKLDPDCLFMATEVINGNPCKYYQTQTALRAFEINPYGIITSIID